LILKAPRKSESTKKSMDFENLNLSEAQFLKNLSNGLDYSLRYL
jgi:hypothetical protein